MTETQMLRDAQNCLTCKWRGPARTPQCSKMPEHAATCEYPLPSFTMIAFNVTDVARHINLATIIEGSEFYHPAHASRECLTWEALAATRDDVTLPRLDGKA